MENEKIDVKIDKDDNVKVKYYSELMKNYEPEMPLDAGKEFKVISDRLGHPIIFTIGTDDKFYITDTHENNNNHYEISKFLDNHKVISFDVHKDETEKARIAFSSQKDGLTYFYLSKLIDLDEDIKWSEFLTLKDNWSEHWESHRHNQNVKINKIVVDEELAIVSTHENGDAKLYVTNNTNSSCEEFKLPENGSKIIDFKLGLAYEDKGVFLLYEIGSLQTLIFMSFPDSRYNKSTYYKFSVNEKLSSISTLLDEDGNSTLFACGRGLYSFKHSYDDSNFKTQTIVKANENQYLTQFDIVQFENEISIWAMSDNNISKESELLYISNQFYDVQTNSKIQRWTSPLVTKNRKVKFSSLRNKEFSNQLFVTAKDNTLSYLWQDKQTTLWQESYVHLKDTGAYKEFDSYTINVQFESDNIRKTFLNQEIELRASSPMYINIENLDYLLTDKPVKIKLNELAKLAMIIKTQNINTPQISISADFLKENFVINTSDKLLEKLRTIQTGEDLSNQKRVIQLSNGTTKEVPLWQGIDEPDNIDDVAKAIKTFIDTKEQLENATKIQTRRVLKGAITDKNIWGMSFENGIKHLNEDAALETLNSKSTPTTRRVLRGGLTNFGSYIGNTFGDFVSWIGERINDVKNFIIKTVNGIVEFIIKIGEEVYKFILDTAEQIIASMTLFFKKIGLFFNELFEWLGYIFNWQDILETKDAVKEFFNSSMSAFSMSNENIKTHVDIFFDDLLTKLDSPELTNAFNQDSINKTVDEFNEKAKDNRDNEFTSDLLDPKSNFMESKKHYINSGFKSAKDIENDSSSINSFINSISEKLEIVYSQLSKIGYKAQELIDGECSIGDFGLTAIKSVGAIVIKLIRDFIIGILEILEVIMQGANTVLNSTMNIPLISTFYKNVVTNGDELTFLDLLSLIIAIPITIGYKISTKRHIFEDVNKDEFSIIPQTLLSEIIPDNTNLRTRILTASKDNPKQNNWVETAHIITGIGRLLRVFTFGSSSLAKFFKSETARSKGEINYWTSIDDGVRFFTVTILTFGLLAQNKESKTYIKVFIQFIIYFSIFGFRFNKATDTPTLNQGNALLVTAAGIAGIFTTAIDWDNDDKFSDADRSSQIAILFFQLPAYFQYYFSKTKNPEAAATTFVIREFAMLMGAIFEFFSAGKK